MTKNINTTKQAAATKLAEAGVKLAQPADRLSQLRIDSAAASTVSQRLAAADKAASFVADTDAAAWTATLNGRRLIGENMYEAFSQKAADADANVERKAASAVTFTTLMASLYGLDKAGYEAFSKAERKGPGKRSWSALAEDYACFVVTTGDTWADAYALSLGDSAPSVRGYTTFSRTAEAEQARATEAGETSQAASARTKRERLAAQAAEAQRQAEAAEARKAERKAEQDEAERKAANAATLILRHVTEHPSANLVPGVELTCSAAAALNVTTLRTLAHAASVLADEAERVAAEAAEAAPAEQAASHGTEAEAAALGAAAEAAAPAPDMAAQFAAFQAWQASQGPVTAWSAAPTA